LGWVDGYITSQSGNVALVELFQIPSLVLGGTDAVFYSSYITRMPSRVSMNGAPLTNSFYRDNPAFVQYQFGSEYNNVSSDLSIDYLNPDDVLRAYSHYTSHLQPWQEGSLLHARQSGPFALPPSTRYEHDPLLLHQASLSTHLNRIDPWISLYI
jgi:hypothetical protein